MERSFRSQDGCLHPTHDDAPRRCSTEIFIGLKQRLDVEEPVLARIQQNPKHCDNEHHYLEKMLEAIAASQVSQVSDN